MKQRELASPSSLAINGSAQSSAFVVYGIGPSPDSPLAHPVRVEHRRRRRRAGRRHGLPGGIQASGGGAIAASLDESPRLLGSWHGTAAARWGEKDARASGREDPRAAGGGREGDEDKYRQCKAGDSRHPVVSSVCALSPSL